MSHFNFKAYGDIEVHVAQRENMVEIAANGRKIVEAVFADLTAGVHIYPGDDEPPKHISVTLCDGMPEGWYPLSDYRHLEVGRVLVSTGKLTCKQDSDLSTHEMVIARWQKGNNKERRHPDMTSEGWVTDSGGFYMGAKMWRFLPSLGGK
jgi:hypothetical protein